MATSSTISSAAAEALTQAHRTRRLLTVEPFPLADEAQAYEVQGLLADRLGHRSVSGHSQTSYPA